VILGGHSPAPGGGDRQGAAHGDGWIGGSGRPTLYAFGRGRGTQGLDEGEVTGRPRMLALAYFATLPEATETAGEHLRDYYGFAPPYAKAVLDKAAIGTRPSHDRCRVRGCRLDELILVPCTNDSDR